MNVDTKKLTSRKGALMIAHRGCSGIEPENTISAFIAAANRSYYGIETDVHKTKDGKFIITHDDNAKRVTGVDTVIEQTDFEVLHSLKIFDKEGNTRSDLHMPTLEEYITICKRYGKVAVLELKNEFEETDIFEICEIIDSLGYLNGTIFISFAMNNLLHLKKKYKNQTAQFLISNNLPIDLPERLASLGLDLDVYYKEATKELVSKCHELGVKVNVWTVDEIIDAEWVIENGVDFITSNIIE